MIEATPRTLFTWFAHRTFVLLSRRWPRTLHSNIMVEILPFHTWFMRLAQIYHCTLRIIHASCVGHILSALTTAAGGHGTAKLKGQSIQKTGRRRHIVPIDICGFRWSLSPADSGREFSILSTYVPNDLNQYSPRSMSLADRKADVIGLAAVVNGTPTTVNITVNGGPASGPDYRRGEYFWKAVAASGAGPNWLAVGVTAGSSPTASGGVYVPPQTENFGPDTDGNLISDARWLYKWDAENRLVRIETQPAAAAYPAPTAVAVPAKRVQYTYDYRGRMVRRQVFSGTYIAGTPPTITWSSTPDAAAAAD